MGFLQKDWDWESHDSPETEKLKKERKIWLWVLAFLCFGLSIFVMYHTEHTLYGGVIEANAFGYAIALLAAGIGTLLREEEAPKEPKPQTPLKKWLGRGVVVASVLFLLWAVITWKGFFVIGLQMFCLLPLGFVLDRKKEQGDTDQKELMAWNILLSYTILVVATLIAPKIMGLSTVQEEAERLETAGYKQVVYVESVEGSWLHVPFGKISALTEEERDTEMYLFSGKKEEELWGIAIDPWTGQILAEEKAPENSNLAVWLEE